MKIKCLIIDDEPLAIRLFGVQVLYGKSSNWFTKNERRIL